MTRVGDPAASRVFSARTVAEITMSAEFVSRASGRLSLMPALSST
ncbi:hypothetical protein [Streptosporangium sp. KLBMP 9127]